MLTEEKQLYDVVIIGGGPAGLTAAIYLARACYRVLVVEKEKFGGQITITSEVVNYPGVFRTSGEELARFMQQQAEKFGAEFLKAEVTDIQDAGDVKKIVTDRGVFASFGILLATGARPRMIGFKGESEFKGHGVAYCATCDGEFFTGKEVFVVGGGFAAAEESVFLTRYAKHVTILMRGDDFTCAVGTADAARNHEKISIIPHVEIKEAAGDTLLRRLSWRDRISGEETVFEPENGDTFGIFVFAGYEPETALVKDLVELDPKGYVITDRQQKTSVEGIYAAGDVCIKNLRQVVTAVGDGAQAATELEKYAAAMHKKTGKVPKIPTAQSSVHVTADSGRTEIKTVGGEDASSGSPITPEMLTQLQTVFSKMENRLLLRLYLDERPVSDELKLYMETLVNATDKLKAEIQPAGVMPAAELPCVKICREDGSETGLAFHGVPGGHEFTSFVLGLYNAAGPGQSIDKDVQDMIVKLEKDIHMILLVSLSCTMCPELVVAAQRIAAANDRIRTDVYDISHFPELKEKYQVMSVPCMVINEGKPYFGKKDIRQVAELLQSL